jgi:hypothetical protein
VVLFTSKEKKESSSTTMPPASTDKIPSPSPKVMSMASTAEEAHQNQAKDYYKAGSSEIVTETKLTVSRLETRRRLTKTSDKLVIVLVGLPVRIQYIEGVSLCVCYFFLSLFLLWW